MSAARGFFLVIEGLDGAGKTEIARRLAVLLRQDRPPSDPGVLLTYEPHDASLGGEFIRQVLRKEVATSPRTLALAFAANRADHLDRQIEPFLAGGPGHIVISDRYYLSSLVYQTTPTLPIEYVMGLNAGARPADLTLFLSASAETCYHRIHTSRLTRELFDERLAEMRLKYAEAIAYLRARGEHIEEIDADGTISQVLNAVLRVLGECRPTWMQVPALAAE